MDHSAEDRRQCGAPDMELFSSWSSISQPGPDCLQDHHLNQETNVTHNLKASALITIDALKAI